jgi:hypothetical protein
MAVEYATFSVFGKLASRAMIDPPTIAANPPPKLKTHRKGDGIRCHPLATPLNGAIACFVFLATADKALEFKLDFEFEVEVEFDVGGIEVGEGGREARAFDRFFFGNAS